MMYSTKCASSADTDYLNTCSGLWVFIYTWLYLGRVWARVNSRMAFCRSNLSLSVCPRETWRSQCLDFSPEWALSGSDSPMELEWTHKDSLFATVTAHPHERESQTQTLASQNWMYFTVDVRKGVFKAWFDWTWNLIVLFYACFLFYKIPTLLSAQSKDCCWVTLNICFNF